MNGTVELGRLPGAVLASEQNLGILASDAGAMAHVDGATSSPRTAGLAATFLPPPDAPSPELRELDRPQVRAPSQPAFGFELPNISSTGLQVQSHPVTGSGVQAATGPSTTSESAAATASLLHFPDIRIDDAAVQAKLDGLGGWHGPAAAAATDGFVVIDASSISGDGGALLQSLSGLGLQEGSAFGASVSGRLPIAALDALGGVADLAFVREALAVGSAGSVANQADIAMRADIARTSYGVDGSGVRIGVLSDSYNNLGGAAADIASGDLPAGGVTVLDEYSGSGSDEGRAMLQLIHDLAPGAGLLFHTAFEGVASFAQGIVDLFNAGARVIVDDVIYLNEAMFQDGPIAQAVDQVVAQGAAYFSSAGNSARNGYESAFRGSEQFLDFGGVAAELHDFDPGAGVDVTQSIHVPVGASTTISFQWDQPFASVSPALGGSQSDIDILILDANGNRVGGGLADNIGGDARELFGYTNNTASSTLQVAIANYAGADPGAMRYVGFGSYSALEYGGGPTIYGHAAAAGAQAVAAAWYARTPAYGVSPPQVESFSSAGTSKILFDTAGNRLPAADDRRTPDITAVDGSNTTFFGTDVDGDGAPNFFGTSAAAPHAAAVAALMLQANPTLTPIQIYDVLKATALDMDDPSTPGFDTGWDAATGYGLIRADAAVAAVATGGGTYTGDALANALTGGAGNDTMFGMGGNDTLLGAGGDDSIDGGAGADLVYGDNGNDQIAGGEGADILAGMNHADEIWGNAGADAIYGNSGEDSLYGGPGDDMLHGGVGSDLLYGGIGADLIYGLWTLEAFARHGAAAATAAGAVPDTLFGAAGNDTIYGGNGADRIEGGTDTDVLAGLWGDDLVHGGDGDDLVYGNTGADTLNGNGGHDRIYGGSGADSLHGGEGDDTLLGLWDIDTFFVNGSTDGSAGAESAETLAGGAGSDSLVGSSGSDLLQGEDGNDHLVGLWGDDVMQGGTGDDALYGNPGNDLLRMGEGADYAHGGHGADTVFGDGGNDRIEGWGADDELHGGIGDDLLAGNAGDDLLYGDDGDDWLSGGDGTDRLDGGAGADTLLAVWGSDSLTGGAGADIFVAHSASHGSHTITDYSAAEGDRIEFRSADAGGRTAVQGQSWVEVRDSQGHTLLTLEGVTDPAGLNIVV